MVKLLLTYKVDIKSKNLEGLTTVDILREREFLGDRELREKLDGGHIILKILKMLSKWTLSFVKRFVITDHREILHMSKEDRNAILVVSVLIATATYQAILSPPDKDHSSIDTKFLGIPYELFKYFNSVAFVASMIEICLHLPSGIGYTIHLVLPLIICYVLLMIFWWSYSTNITAIAVFALILTKIPVVRQKISGDLNQKKSITLGTLLKRNPNMERELNQISVHFWRTSND